jgi:hypothetical protein
VDDNNVLVEKSGLDQMAQKIAKESAQQYLVVAKRAKSQLDVTAHLQKTIAAAIQVELNHIINHR